MNDDLLKRKGRVEESRVRDICRVEAGGIVSFANQISKHTSASAATTRTITAAPPVSTPSTTASVSVTPVSTTPISTTVVFNFGCNHFHISLINRGLFIIFMVNVL